ncbi:lymphocyte antigen 6G-like [Clarias gariepinus]|uniref:lymphocyte antigen 6G-like n=1 Tax=Clarias gariepinus TaxID=13013 RepID=UPI00234DEDF7|nr:lymphocyte antigen 6G-like [Clarias gariepinus]
MRSLVAFVFICMVLPKAASGLSCYTCDPTNCNKYLLETCSSGSNYCFTASANVLNNKFTLKTCATKEICDGAQSFITGAAFSNVKCCQENLCNSAERFTLSFLFMFIPLLFSILFY